MIYEEKLISQKPKWLLENSLKMSVKGERWGWCEGQGQFSGLSPRDGLGRGGRVAGMGTLAETEVALVVKSELQGQGKQGLVEMRDQMKGQAETQGAGQDRGKESGFLSR